MLAFVVDMEQVTRRMCMFSAIAMRPSFCLSQHVAMRYRLAGERLEQKAVFGTLRGLPFDQGS